MWKMVTPSHVPHHFMVWHSTETQTYHGSGSLPHALTCRLRPSAAAAAAIAIAIVVVVAAAGCAAVILLLHHLDFHTRQRQTHKARPPLTLNSRRPDTQQQQVS
jgi:hypothetical protein